MGVLSSGGMYRGVAGGSDQNFLHISPFIYLLQILDVFPDGAHEILNLSPTPSNSGYAIGR